MENASKALIIAGAILLSILIIALGVFIFNQAKSAINTDTLSSTEVDTFNAQFDNYMGTILGSNVKSLISAINSNGATNQDTMEKLPAVYYFANGVTSVTSATTVNGGYNGTLTYDSTNKIGTFTVGNMRGANEFNITNYQSGLSTVKNAIADSHNYKVSVAGYNETGYIAAIVIVY